jgi:hypothetical protein
MILENKSTEGATAKAIEEQTSKLPSDLFLYASLTAMGASLTLKFMGKKHSELFVGQWAAPFLLLGIYNKLVKLKGHDAQDKNVNENGMEKQNQDFTANEEFRDTDQGFNARNQNNEFQGVESSEWKDLNSSDGSTSSRSFTDLEQDDSGNLISNN